MNTVQKNKNCRQMIQDGKQCFCKKTKNRYSQLVKNTMNVKLLMEHLGTMVCSFFGNIIYRK